MSGGAGEPVEIDGGERAVRLTSPERVLWPELGLTKAWLVGYYRSVAEVMLPHVCDHPVTLHRFPGGVREPHFYQTKAPPHPPWVRTVTFRPGRSGKVFEVVVIEGLPSLLWAAQMSSVEIHPYLGRADALDRPTALVFDLDPGAPAGPVDAARVALLLRGLLQELDLVGYPKTSGRKGMHVVVPLDATQPYDVTKRFARAAASLLTRQWPASVLDTMSRAERRGKVLVDWSQNDAQKSTVAPYSLRGLDIPTVSTPLSWEEVDDAVGASDPLRLRHTADDVLARIDRLGDLHAGVLTTAQRLPDLPT